MECMPIGVHFQPEGRGRQTYCHGYTAALQSSLTPGTAFLHRGCGGLLWTVLPRPQSEQTAHFPYKQVLFP